MIPQFVVLGLAVFSLGISAADHGNQKITTECFWTSLIAVLINLAILYWGGFFNVFFR